MHLALLSVDAFDSSTLVVIPRFRTGENMKTIRVEFNENDNLFSVFNDGTAIPIVKHATEKIYVPGKQSIIFSKKNCNFAFKISLYFIANLMWLRPRADIWPPLDVF
jgi:hypothetical protein